VVTYAIERNADITAEDTHLDFSASDFTVRTTAGSFSVHTPLIGRHNVYNILGATGAALALGLDVHGIKRGVEALEGVPGRLERVRGGQDFHVFVDYAHTEDALRNVLSSLRKVSQAKIILVFGCGGDRDRTKRPKMGRAASELADFTILTSDNPRGEDPLRIIDDIKEGFPGTQRKILPERREAIREALRMARTGDVVLIAGKGHENYQIFKDKTVPFDDRAVVQEQLPCLR